MKGLAIALGVFLAAILTDVVWARWTIACAARRPVHAAAFAAAIVILSAVNILAFTASGWYVIAAALGAIIGTYFAVRERP